MSLLNNRVGRLEAALAVGALMGTKAKQIRLLLIPEHWAEVPVGSLIHVGGRPSKVYRYVGEYDPVSSTFRGEEVELSYHRSWGLQPVDFLVLDLA